MREQRQIVERWHQGSALIFVTLVRVQGSSYRQPARLIVRKDGTYEGSISGGGLEADLLRKAPWMTRDGASVERYSTLFDETADIPFGLGCASHREPCSISKTAQLTMRRYTIPRICFP
jgi:xanthine/CO dehydrogenase XdhC/CoxF family maturation factor